MHSGRKFIFTVIFNVNIFAVREQKDSFNEPNATRMKLVAIQRVEWTNNRYNRSKNKITTTSLFSARCSGCFYCRDVEVFRAERAHTPQNFDLSSSSPPLLLRIPLLGYIHHHHLQNENGGRTREHQTNESEPNLTPISDRK